MAKNKFALCLLLFVAIGIISCDKDKPYEPITLSFADGSGNLNSINCIGITLPEQFPPLIISGGDGHYTITNNCPECIDYEFDGRILTVKSVAAGWGNIIITDRSGNSYELQAQVTNPQISVAQLYTYPLVKTDGMDPTKKTELEYKIINDAPKGAWDFGSTSLSKGMVTIAKRYFSNTEDSEFIEYSCTFEGEAPSGHRSFAIATQIETWFVMKSDTEEFILYLCQPFIEDGKQMRGYNLVRDVTDKYIDDYPEITRAYEIQTGYLQSDWQ